MLGYLHESSSNPVREARLCKGIAVELLKALVVERALEVLECERELQNLRDSRRCRVGRAFLDGGRERARGDGREYGRAENRGLHDGGRGGL